MPRPDIEKCLNVRDVESFPNGMATIWEIEGPQAREIILTRLDERGYLRQIGDRESYIMRDNGWSVVGPVE